MIWERRVKLAATERAAFARDIGSLIMLSTTKVNASSPREEEEYVERTFAPRRSSTLIRLSTSFSTSDPRYEILQGNVHLLYTKGALVDWVPRVFEFDLSANFQSLSRLTTSLCNRDHRTL
jgi:hypothetical protein